MYQRGFARLLLVSMIVILGIGGLLWFLWVKGLIRTRLMQEFFPTPTMIGDETTNWKMYRNDELGFEISYPISWTDPTIERLPTLIKIDLNNQIKIQKGFYKNKETQQEITLDEYLKYFPPLDSPIEKIEEYKATYGVGKKFTYEGIEAKTQEIEIIFAESNDSTEIYTINYTLNRNDKSGEKLLEQILSTFRFINGETEFTFQ